MIITIFYLTSMSLIAIKMWAHAATYHTIAIVWMIYNLIIKPQINAKIFYKHSQDETATGSTLSRDSLCERIIPSFSKGGVDDVSGVMMLMVLIVDVVDG